MERIESTGLRSKVITVGTGPPLSPVDCDASQLELFPPEVTHRAGKPIRLVVRDPNRPEQSRAMIIASPRMREVHSIIQRVSPTDETVLLLGESGSGKNWLAWLIHSLSTRKDKPFIEVDVSHHPEGLLESALFGHEKGAFTGATESRNGKVALAVGTAEKYYQSHR